LRAALANSSRDPISKNNQNKMDLRCSSSSRVPAMQKPALQVKALSSNPSSTKKERKEGREGGRKKGRKEGRKEGRNQTKTLELKSVNN
jgi:flagellar biosynthesis/type III secretory pathway protein FliH